MFLLSISFTLFLGMFAVPLNNNAFASEMNVNMTQPDKIEYITSQNGKIIPVIYISDPVEAHKYMEQHGLKKEALQQRPARLPAFLLFIIDHVIIRIGSLHVWGIRLGFLWFLLLPERGQDRIRQLLANPDLLEFLDGSFTNLLQ